MYHPVVRMSPQSTVQPDLARDPFGERAPALCSSTLRLLGGQFHFESNSQELLRLAQHAFAGLPRHRLPGEVPGMRVRLLLTGSGSTASGRGGKRPPRLDPPALSMFSGANLLGGATESSSCVIVSPQERAALVVVPRQMLRFPYHTRYELIEFAVYALAARVQRLAALHGACVGHERRGVLLMGASGAGKSTVTLQCLLNGLDFLAEDSLFVDPRTLLATAAPNFIHVRTDSLGWVDRAADVASIRRSPVIRRRSGVRKFEVDLRRGRFRLAPAPLRIEALVFLSAQQARTGSLLTRLSGRTVRHRLTVAQAYAAGQPEWPLFLRNVLRLPAFELYRGGHPREAVAALRGLLA